MELKLYDRTGLDAKAWDRYVLAHAFADHYHLSGWCRVINTAYGYEPLYVTAWEDQDLRGIVPVVVMGGLWRRKSLVSLPFLDYGGICADHPDVAHGLYEVLQNQLKARNGSVLDLRHRRDLPIPLARHGDKVTLTLGLENSAEKMWKKLGGKVRNQIRKAEKEHLQACWAGDEGLQAFYQVYVWNMRDLGSPPHSLRFFRQVMAEFSDTRIVLVQLGDKVIGGALCLVFRDTMMVPWASSLRSHFRLCPNNLLYWEAIRTACEQGLRRFDFGRSSRESGTYKFKQQWGTQEEPLHWQSNLPGGDLIGASDGRLLRRVMQVWQTLPVSLTRFVGPILRRRISN